jgi:radical SAM-linked protein
VPKPQTPFQWAAQIDVAETEARQSLLRRELGRRHIRFKWHDARTSYLEGVFSRGDRRLGALLLAAYRLGCRFYGWTEHYRFDLWEQAFAETGVEPRDYLRRRYLDEILPWDHLGCGVTKEFLQRELAYAVEGKLTPDCSIARCTYCGACDFTAVKNVTYHLKGAKGGEHRGSVIDNWAQITVGAGDEAGAWEPRGWHKQQAKRSSAHPTGRPVAAGVSPAGARRAPQHVAEQAPLSLDSPPDDALRRPVGPPPGTEAGAMKPDTAATAGLGNAEEWLNAGSEALAPAVTSGAAAMRVRLTYAKRDRARFISHLELIEIIDRACRRARLPLAFSQGHRPAPRLRFSPGLAVGAESDCEVLDIDLTEVLPAEDVGRRFGAHLPDGLRVLAAAALSLRAPSPEAGLEGYRYLIDVGDLIGDGDDSWLDERLAAFERRAAFPMRRRSGKGEKDIDARPLVARIARSAPATVALDVRFTAAGSVKPSDLLAAILGLDPIAARSLPLHKTHAFYRTIAVATGPQAAPTAVPAERQPLGLDRPGA